MVVAQRNGAHVFGRYRVWSILDLSVISFRLHGMFLARRQSARARLFALCRARNGCDSVHSA